MAPPDDHDGDASLQTEAPAGALPPGRQDSREVVRRMIVIGVAVLAVGFFVLAGVLADTDTNDEVGVSGDIVERLTPARDQEALRQTPIALDLDDGWSLAALSVNGTPTREDEWQVTASLGLYQFQPGEGKSVEALTADRNCAHADIFQLADPTNTRIIDWCFTVA